MATNHPAGKSILFHRDYDRYSGGQQKVFDYFSHCLADPGLNPSIYFANQEHACSVDDLWKKHEAQFTTSYEPASYDIAFLAGMDWQAYLPVSAGRQPVVNLIQHVRHGDKNSNVYPFLSEPALRMCVSPEVEEAILATGRVNGPTIVIPNGIDAKLLETFAVSIKTLDVYILGNKQPDLARDLDRNLRQQGFNCLCHDVHMPRDSVLHAMASSKVCVLLPHATEGFYLPALEAMALSRLVVVPDCVGNRSFCHPGENCLTPQLDLIDISQRTLEALEIEASSQAKVFLENASATLALHSLEREASLFRSEVLQHGYLA